MIHFGLAGVFGAPPAPPPPVATQFQPGDLWENRRGAIFVVDSVKQGTATLINVDTLRKVYRFHRDIEGWKKVS